MPKVWGTQVTGGQATTKKVTSLGLVVPPYGRFSPREILVISCPESGLTTQIGRPEMVVEVFLMRSVPEAEPIILVKPYRL